MGVVNEWKEITFADVPSVDEFKALTISLMRQGLTNSDRIRDAIRRDRKLILSRATGRWNDSPSDKFVNEHAWALEQLVVEQTIEKAGEKDYRLTSL